MKTLTLLFTLLLTLTITSLAENKETPTEFIHRWAKDFNKNDPTVISKFYENSKELEMLVSVGLWHHGYDEMVKAYQGDAETIKYYDSRIQKLRVRTFDNTAIVGFEHLFKFKIFETEQHVQVHIRTTSTLRCIDGKWLIVLEHSSPIQGIQRADLIPKTK